MILEVSSSLDDSMSLCKFPCQHKKEKEEVPASTSIANEIKINLCADAWYITATCIVSCIVFQMSAIATRRSQNHRRFLD